MNKTVKKTVIMLIWLALWQVIAFFVDNPLYFASPFETVSELIVKLGDGLFWESVGRSLVRILGGFCAACLLAYLCAVLSFTFSWLGSFLEPFIAFLKSVPVAAVAVILLIWWGPPYLVLCISMMVVFPNIYMNLLTGLRSADKKLLEMADIFEMRPKERLLWIFRPAYVPYLHSAVSVSLGMGFKSGVAAEIIGLPEFSIGERLYRDKIYLNTPGVFAWVVVILVLGALTERIIMFALNRFSDFPAPCPQTCDALSSMNDHRVPRDHTVITKDLEKSYGGRKVVDANISLERGKIYAVVSPSGTGKTTFLNILAGLVKADSGSFSTGKISMVFQDDRLIEQANGPRNLQIAKCTGDLSGELAGLLSFETAQLPASKMSGGERRRLAVARAILADSDVVIMDEPFSGMDNETVVRTSEWILHRLNGRTLLMSTHDADIVSGLNAVIVKHTS